MSIRVANILLEPRLSGPVLRSLLVAQRLSGTEIEQVVVIPQRGSDYAFKRLRDANVPAVQLPLTQPSRNPWQLLKGAFAFWCEVWRLSRWMRRAGIQVVHCNGVWQPHGILAGRLVGAGVLLHLNDTWTTPWMRAMFTAMGPFCDGYIIAAHRVEQAYFKGSTRPRLNKPRFHIPAPVDVERFTPRRCHVNDSVSHVKVVVVCSVNPAKGLEHFIRMAALVNERKESSVTFSVVGPEIDTQVRYSRSLREEARHRSVHNIIFEGATDDVPAALRGADIYVCSSIREASPMAVWEAMATGLPIVSTDVGDVSSYIIDGQNGYVVPVGDAAQMAERVITLINNPQMRREFGRQARETAISKLGLDACASKHAYAYRIIAQKDR